MIDFIIKNEFSKIQFIKGNVLQKSDTNRIIAHIVNNKGGFGAGFALAICKKYPLVRDKYKEWYGMSLLLGNAKFQLGDIQKVRIDDNLSIVNMLAQNGYMSSNNPVPLDYEALEKCLDKLSVIEKDAEIWMPDLIGCGLGGGNREIVLGLIEQQLKNREVKIFKL